MFEYLIDKGLETFTCRIFFFSLLTSLGFETFRKWMVGKFVILDERTVRAAIVDSKEVTATTLHHHWEKIDLTSEKYLKYTRALAEVEGSIEYIILSDEEDKGSKLKRIIKGEVNKIQEVLNKIFLKVFISYRTL